MSVDVFHPDIVEVLDKERIPIKPKGPMPIRPRILLWRESIQLIVDHKDTPEKESIVEEVERDLDEKYRIEEITMQERLYLLGVLSGARRPPAA